MKEQEFEERLEYWSNEGLHTFNSERNQIVKQTLSFLSKQYYDRFGKWYVARDCRTKKEVDDLGMDASVDMGRFK